MASESRVIVCCTAGAKQVTRSIEITAVDINSLDSNEAWARKIESVHRELRPQLPTDYLGAMARVFGGGGEMLVAVIKGEVVGLAVFRTYENTVFGVHMYVDDLVTAEKFRSQGVGKALLERAFEIARERGCKKFTLDSGTQRKSAHKFYFREGMVVDSFHFTKDV